MTTIVLWKTRSLRTFWKKVAKIPSKIVLASFQRTSMFNRPRSRLTPYPKIQVQVKLYNPRKIVHSVQSFLCKHPNSSSHRNQSIHLGKNVGQAVPLDPNSVGRQYQAPLVAIVTIKPQLICQCKVVDVGKAYLLPFQQRSIQWPSRKIINHLRRTHRNQTMKKIKTGSTEFKIGAR